MGTTGREPNGWERGASSAQQAGASASSSLAAAWQLTSLIAGSPAGVPPSTGGPTAQRLQGRHLSEKEERAHFALWAILKSPLFIAANLRHIGTASLAVLGGREVIAINQDELGVPGDLIWKQGPKEVGQAGAELGQR